MEKAPEASQSVKDVCVQWLRKLQEVLGDAEAKLEKHQKEMKQRYDKMIRLRRQLCVYYFVFVRNLFVKKKKYS